MSLSKHGKYAEAEAIERELLQVKKRVLGTEHPGTLTSARNLGSHQSEHIQREVLGVQRRVLGSEHPDTLKSAVNLSMSLFEANSPRPSRCCRRRLHRASTCSDPPIPTRFKPKAIWKACACSSTPNHQASCTGRHWRGATAARRHARRHSRARAAARRQARAQRQVRARAVVRLAHRPVCGGALDDGKELSL
jgi:hypothetical protein